MNRRLVLTGVAALLAAWVGLLLWASTERLHVVVTADNGRVEGSLNGVSVAAATNQDTGEVGFFLQGADPRATPVWPADGRPVEPADDLARLLARLAAESAWTNVRITNLDTGQVISEPLRDGGWRPFFGDWFAHPFGGQTTASPGLALVGAPDWRNYRVDADLLRPRGPAGILIRSRDGSDGMLFYFRVEDRDLMWFNLVGGAWRGPIASAPYRAFAQEPVAAVQDVLRLLLGGLPAALAFVGLVLLLASIEPGVTAGVARLRSRLDSPARVGDKEAGGSGAMPPGPTGFSLAPALVPVTVRAAALPRETAATFARQSDLGAPRYSEALSKEDRWVQIAAGMIVLAGLLLTLNIANVLLQRMPHVQDSVAYLFQAKTYALGRLWVPSPPHPQFFVHEFVIMTPDGRWFGKYPPGWPMLLAIGVRAGAAWVVDPICGALSLLMLYLIGRDVYHPRVGLLAAVLGLTAPFWMFLSASMMAHASGLLFTLVGVYGLWLAAHRRRFVWPSILAGLGWGMALLIRPYTALVIVVPFALFCLWFVLKHPLDGLKRFVPALLVVLPFVAAFFVYNRVMTGHFLLPPQELWWKWDKVGFGPDKGPWGYYPIDALNNTSRNLAELLTHGFGWPPFLTLAFAVVPFATGRARAWDWLFLLGFLAVVVGYAFWWADGIMYGPRFYFEGFGFLILLTARGFDVALGFASRAPVTRALILATVAGLVAYNVTAYLPGQWQLYRGYNYTNHGRLDAVAAAGIHHAVVFANTTSQYAWWDYGMVFSANDPLLNGDVVYARDLGDRADCQLRLDYPNRSFWKLEGTTVTPLPACPP